MQYFSLSTTEQYYCNTIDSGTCSSAPLSRPTGVTAVVGSPLSKARVRAPSTEHPVLPQYPVQPQYPTQLTRFGSSGSIHCQHSDSQLNICRTIHGWRITTEQSICWTIFSWKIKAELKICRASKDGTNFLDKTPLTLWNSILETTKIL